MTQVSTNNGTHSWSTLHSITTNKCTNNMKVSQCMNKHKSTPTENRNANTVLHKTHIHFIVHYCRLCKCTYAAITRIYTFSKHLYTSVVNDEVYVCFMKYRVCVPVFCGCTLVFVHTLANFHIVCTFVCGDTVQCASTVGAIVCANLCHCLTTDLTTIQLTWWWMESPSIWDCGIQLVRQHTHTHTRTLFLSSPHFYTLPYSLVHTLSFSQDSHSGFLFHYCLPITFVFSFLFLSLTFVPLDVNMQTSHFQ